MSVKIVSASELDFRCLSPLRYLEECRRCSKVKICKIRRLKPEAEKLLERLEYHQRMVQEDKKKLTELR
jgi:hypothetical protein